MKGQVPFLVLLAALACATFLPAAAQAIPTEGCYCPNGAWRLMTSTSYGYPCMDMDSQLRDSLAYFADSACPENGACFGTYTTQYPACTMNSEGFYIQTGTLKYKCIACL